MDDHNQSTKTKIVQNKTLTADSVTLQQHIPVMLDEVFTGLSPKSESSYLDLTAGYGGHANKIATVVKAKNMTLVDRDLNAVKVLSRLFSKSTIVHQDYGSVLRDLISTETSFDLILADIGVSSPHLDDSNRGFSFLRDGPLDMRMDQSAGITAAEALSTLSEEDLADVLYQYGEERSSRRIAKAIKKEMPVTRTLHLATIVEKVKGRGKRGYKHPATQVFQALRVYINQELSQLETLLKLGPKLLNENGRLAIITFHSLEDRLVKRRFNYLGQDGYDSEYSLPYKKVIQPSSEEIAFNPRARSAKLRVLKQKQK